MLLEKRILTDTRTTCPKIHWLNEQEEIRTYLIGVSRVKLICDSSVDNSISN